MTDGAEHLRVHARRVRSRANGPGLRLVVWFQGCDLACPGCYNPETHAPEGGETIRVADLVAEIAQAASEIDGVSLSGGEPFQQPGGLLALVRALRTTTQLSILVFSGYRRAELERMPVCAEILEHLDVLIDGRFVAPLRLARGLRGSSNQGIHLFSDRYSEAEVAATPPAEITISPTGDVMMTGVDPLILDGDD